MFFFLLLNCLLNKQNFSLAARSILLVFTTEEIQLVL